MVRVVEGLFNIFEAPQRWGKTLGAVMWAWDYHTQGRKIFSNIQLGFPHEPLEFSEMKLEDGSTKFRNGHIFIDELNFYFDCRRSLKDENIEASAFLLQQKKQGCNLFGTTHDLASLDLRARNAYDYIINPSVYPRFPETPQIIKMKIENGPRQAFYSKTLVLDCKPFLGLYDSFAVYDPFKRKVKV